MTRPAIVSASLFAAVVLFACGLDEGPFFTTQKMPEDQAAFNAGRLGLLTPDLTKENELIAFRLLSGLKLGDGYENAGALRKSVMIDAADLHPTGPEAWVKARQSVSDHPAPIYISEYRNSRSSPLVFYQNCLDDAFETAARTLDHRRRQYPSQAAFISWVIAQDQVFANCSSEKPAYPDAIPLDAPALVRADRDYQIAAAHFYSEDLRAAEQRFRSIAADQTSPWQHIAAYMVGRTLLREVSLQNNTAAAPLARDEFAKISRDPSAGPLASSARGLLEHLDAIQHAGQVMDSLSKRLLLPHPEPNAFADTLQQCTYILTADSFTQALSEPDIPEAFEWVHSLENRDKAHILERWRSRHTLPWLTLALIDARGKDRAARELIDQADRLSPESPAFGTATYNAIRLRIESGETEQPRKLLDALLARNSNQPDSLVNSAKGADARREAPTVLRALLNGWRAERMRVATSFDDFLRWAPRIPVGTEFLGRDANVTSPVLAQDSAYILNFKTPLSKLALAAHSPNLPTWSRSDVALATWTRAFMLQNSGIASDMAPIITEAHPDWAPSLTPIGATQADAWKFRAALLIALHHEFQPLVPVDYRKHLALESWWCPVSPPASEPPHPEISWYLPTFFVPPEAVISAQERASAEDEIDQLRQMGSAQSFLAPIIFSWAKSHPGDALVPQALHRLVVVVRYGCQTGDATNGQISKAAFDLLHKQYPKSEWTAKTPYWFK